MSQIFIWILVFNASDRWIFFSPAYSNIPERFMLKTHPSTLSQKYQRIWHMWFVNQTFVSPRAIHVSPVLWSNASFFNSLHPLPSDSWGRQQAWLIYLAPSHTKQIWGISTPCWGLFKVRLQVPHVHRAWTTPWCWFVMQSSSANHLCLNSTQTAIP